MPARNAEAVWQGDLKAGSGRMKFGSGAFDGQYSFESRFEEGTGTNPEELIAAAHAGCFSMALSAGIAKAGFQPKRVQTTAKVTLGKVDEGFAITRIDLTTEAEVDGLDDAKFQELAEGAKKGCPVSKALAAVQTIHLDARLATAAR